MTDLSNLELLLVSTFTDRTLSWSSGCVVKPLPKAHLFLGDRVPFNNTTASTLKFLYKRVQLSLACNCCKYTLLHLDQNSCARCCVRLHFLWQYRSSLLKSPGGSDASLVFPVSSIYLMIIWWLWKRIAECPYCRRPVIDCGLCLAKECSQRFFDDTITMLSNKTTHDVPYWPDFPFPHASKATRGCGILNPLIDLNF